MPSTITHTYIGLDTLKKLNNKPKKIIENNLNNYKVYCQNMDVLYFYHIYLLKSNKIEKLGHKFHTENVLNYFKMLINDNKENKDLELFTFISGLITHYIADRCAHPYINYHAKINGTTKRNDLHFEIETYLDNYYVNKYETNDYYKHNHSKLVFNYTEKDIIKKELDKLFLKYWNTPNMGKYYYRSLKEMQFTYKYIRYDKYGIKRFLLSIIDLNPFNIKRCKNLSYHFKLNKNSLYLNKEHHKWYNIENKKITSNKSFEELYEDIIKKSANIINKLYEYIFENKDINLDKLIENYNYSTGLPIEKTS